MSVCSLCVKASSLPLSIIIVGIGDADFDGKHHSFFYMYTFIFLNIFYLCVLNCIYFICILTFVFSSLFVFCVICSLVLLQPPVPEYAGTEGCFVLRMFFFFFY